MQDQELFDACLLLALESDLTKATLILPAGPGVCLFTTAANKPVLILYGANLRSLVRRRLAEPAKAEKSRRTELLPIVDRIWFRRTFSSFETQLAYFRIARAAYPETYHDLLPHLHAWFLRIDPNADYPHFGITDQIKPHTGLHWGPFGSRKSVNSFLETLQNIFNLCRYGDILAQAPHARACPYAQMNRCAAVCDGTISADSYREIIQQGIDFVNHPHRAIAAMGQQMKDFSAAMHFEQAQQTKTKIELAQKLIAGPYRWVRPIERFYVLSFQRGPMVKLPGQRQLQPTITPFLIGPGWIKQIEPFSLTDALDACRSLLDHLQLAKMQDSQQTSSTCDLEILAWVTRFLYGTSNDKGLYLPADELVDIEDFAAKLQQHFAQPPKGSTKLQLDTFSLTQTDEP